MNVVTQEKLARWLDGLVESGYALIAPRLVGDELLYRSVASSDEIVFAFERTALSPKDAFLPDTQIILEMERRGKQATITEPAMPRDQVLFGVRPCDARGLRALDALLLERPPADAYFAERRGRTTVIGLACPRLWEGCFCTSLGSGPDDASGVDLMLYADGDGYMARVTTDRGAEIVRGLDAEDTASPAPTADPSGELFPVVQPEDWGALFDDAYWRRLANRCLSCHACTYVCPTCRCFDIRDQTVAAGAGHAHYQRLRAWDSCLSPAYRRIAGGHNPRPAKAQRLRNRYYCKFAYSSQVFGAVACVGCGRCIAACPVGIDITEMLTSVAKLHESRLKEPLA